MDSTGSSQPLRASNLLATITCQVLIVIGASACSSTGHNVESEIIAPKTVQHTTSLDSRIAPHYHLFVSILESNGFDVGQTDDPRAMQLKIELVRNPSVLEVEASLWQEETALINVRGLSAAGAVAGSAHLKILARRAAENFERQLVALGPNLVIVADSPPSDGDEQI